jgi:LysM repeat protein
MTAKRTFQLFVVVAILVTSFAATSGALAGGPCPNYVTVQWGETLESIAARCGTTADAIKAANPGLSWWVFNGQVLYLPVEGALPAPTAPVVAPPQPGKTYTVQWGDTLGQIATRNGVSVSDILAVNPHIWNINLIYPGQVITLPAFSTPVSPVAPTQPSGYVPVPYVEYRPLKITFGGGLIVRTGPGRRYDEIQSPYVSAVYDSMWQYRLNSVTVDEVGYVWVEVKLNPLAPHVNGWLLVRDTLGRYYTSPMIDP